MQDSRDLKFLKPLEIEAVGADGFREQIKSEALLPVVAAFHVNSVRAVRPCVLVVDIVAWTSQAQMCTDKVFHELGWREGDELPEADRERLRQRLNAELTESVNAINQNRDAFHLWALKSAAVHIGRLSGHSSISEGLHVLLSSMLIHAWTAFETAAVDLWIAALNECPMPLAISAINNSSGDPDSRSDQKKTESLNFVQTLIERGEQIQAGSVLRHSPKFDLDRYVGIKNAYKAAFGNNGMKTVLAAQPFELLHALNSTRNLLVHSGGIVDSAFLSSARDHRAAFESVGLYNLKKGDQVPVDGELVLSLLCATRDAAASLFTFVDDYLRKATQ